MAETSSSNKGGSTSSSTLRSHRYADSYLARCSLTLHGFLPHATPASSRFSPPRSEETRPNSCQTQTRVLGEMFLEIILKFATSPDGWILITDGSHDSPIRRCGITEFFRTQYLRSYSLLWRTFYLAVITLAWFF